MSRNVAWLAMVAAVLFAAVVGAAGRHVPVPATTQAPALPDAVGESTVERMCGTACHDLTFLLGRRETHERWGAIVEDMSVRGAPGTRQDIETVVASLSTHFGRSAAVPSPSVPSAAAATPSPAEPRPRAPAPPRAAAGSRAVNGDWPLIG